LGSSGEKGRRNTFTLFWEKSEGKLERRAREISEKYARAVHFIKNCVSIGGSEIAQVETILYGSLRGWWEWKNMGKYLESRKTESLDEKSRNVIIKKLDEECKYKIFHMTGGWKRLPNAIWDIVEEDKIHFWLCFIVPLSMVYVVLIISLVFGKSASGEPFTLWQILGICGLLTMSAWPGFVFLAIVPFVVLIFISGYVKLLRIKKKAFNAMQAAS
jgi:hypothetical protein